MKRILVTGATGFIGNYVINELLKDGYTVVATSASQEKAKLCDWFKKAEYISFDLKRINEEKNYFNFFGQPDSLIHLAWEGLPNYKEDFHLYENLPRHLSFLKNLLANGLRDITITGTCLEYGKQEGKLSEDMPPKPSTFYAIAKNELRLRLTEWGQQYPFHFKWIRLFYMYGKGQNPNSLLSQLSRALANEEKVFNMSGGEQTRDFLPVQEMARYIVKIALQNKITGIINCCSGNPVTVKQFIEDYLNGINKSIHLNFGYYPYTDYEPMTFWGDDAKLKTILNDN